MTAYTETKIKKIQHIKFLENIGIKVAKENKRSLTIYVKIRDLFDYESTISKEDLTLIPSILSINPNAKKQRKRKKDKSKKDNIISYPFLQLEYGQNGSVTELSNPIETYSHILGKTITAIYDAASFSHRLEHIYDFLFGDYKLPILQGAIQKDDLKELKNFYTDPNTDEPIDITGMSSKEIFKAYPHIKKEYLDYEMCVVVQVSGLNAKTISRNNKFVNSGESFSSWEAFRSCEDPVVNYISNFSFQTNEEENDKLVHSLYRVDNNLETDKVDKGIILTGEADKNASYFENGCYLYINAISAVKKTPVKDWPNLVEKEVQTKIMELSTVNLKISKWISRMNDNGKMFFESVKKMPKDFNSFYLLTQIISDIELRFDGEFKIIDNDWTKFAQRIDDIHNVLANSDGSLSEKTWKSNAPNDQGYPISKYRTKANLLNFGRRLVLDTLYDTSKNDLDLGKLGIVVKPLTGLSAETKREVQSSQTKNEKVYCDINEKYYDMKDLEFCHIEAKSFGLFNDSQVNDSENIRLAHRGYNRMMGKMNYNDFKAYYKSNSATIDKQLNLAA